MKRILTTIAALLVAGTASAAVLNPEDIVVEGFDGLRNNEDSFTSQGYLYSPAKGTNGQCFEGICLQEDTQGVITNVSDVEAPIEAFDLLGFYLNKNGKVSTGDNLIEITGLLFDGSGQFVIDLNVVEDIRTATVPNTTLNVSDVIWLFDENGNETTELSFDSDGYFMAFKESFLDFTSDIQFRSLTSATLRIDCVVLSPTASQNSPGTAAEAWATFNDCEPNVTQVPLPASILFLGTGIAAFGVVGARKRRKARKAYNKVSGPAGPFRWLNWRTI